MAGLWSKWLWLKNSSTTSYKPIGKDDEPYLEQPKNPCARRFVLLGSALYIFPWITTLAFAFTTLMLAKGRLDYTTNSFATGWKTDFVSARNAVEVKTIRFNGSPSFDENKTMFVPNPDPIKYVGDPSPEIDNNWEKLTWGRYILITEEEAHESWGDEITDFWDNNRGGYVAGLDMFHTLHCLNNMRKTFYPDYYGHSKPDKNTMMHQNHCIEQIRQFIMCSGDMTPIPTKFYPALGRNYVESDQLHTCRNFDKLRDWMVDRYERAPVVPVKMGGRR